MRTNILKDESSSFRLNEKKNRSNKISDDTKRTENEFWRSAGISRPTEVKKKIQVGPVLRCTYLSAILSWFL